jgi:hypothetical protein
LLSTFQTLQRTQKLLGKFLKHLGYRLLRLQVVQSFLPAGQLLKPLRVGLHFLERKLRLGGVVKKVFQWFRG